MRTHSSSCMLFYTFILIVNGLGLIALGLWFLFDPAKNYLLNLVDFSEDDPLLKFTTYITIITGVCVLIVAFLGCFGTLITGKFILTMYILFIIVLALSAVSIITLPILFREKFANDRMPIYLGNISTNRYYRDKWTTPLMDSIQFYHKCCGGKNGPTDYLNSFWYLTNMERGTVSFVPPSCCKQSQDGRAWKVIPIDPLCITYPYGSNAFNNSVNTEGCGKQVELSMEEMVWWFVGAGSITFVVLVIGLISTACFYRHLKFYQYGFD